MCEPMLAGGLVGKGIEQVRDKKKDRDREKVADQWANAYNPNKQPTAKKNPTEKTKMNTGINIGGQY